MNEASNASPTPALVYRAYRIGQDGRIDSATPIKADSDVAAIEAAQQLLDGNPIELWDRGRMIFRFEPLSG